MLKAIGLDHMVLRVPDIEEAIHLFSDLLGMKPLRLEEWREGKVPFPSVQISEGTIIDLGVLDGEPVPDSEQRLSHICVVVEPVDWDEAEKSLEGYWTKTQGPLPRWGARGDGTSLYGAGPGGVIIELRQYDRVPA